MSEMDVKLESSSPERGEARSGRFISAIDRWFALRQPRLTEPLDTQIRVISPENIAFNYRVAGPFQRLFAFLIDVVACVLVFAAFYILMLLVLAVLSILGLDTLIQRISMIAEALIMVAVFLIWWFYAAILETWMNGQTLAKRMLGLRVLSVNGNPITGLQATLRAIIRLVGAMPWVTIQVFDPWINPLFEDVPGTNGQVPAIGFLPTFLVGIVSMTLTKRFQRVGDLVCGTMVVREVKTWGHGLAKFEDARVPHLAEYIPASFVFSQSLSKALAAYVDRRRYFSNARRAEIASHVANPLLERFGLPEDTSYDLFMCALYYRAFIADQGREDAIDLRLNAETRQFEGVVPEHRLQSMMNQNAQQTPQQPLTYQAATQMQNIAAPQSGSGTAPHPETNPQQPTTQSDIERRQS